MTLSPTNQDICNLVKTVINSSSLKPDIDLIDSGLLDSLALVSLIMELEQAYNIQVSYETLEVDQFRSIDSIVTFVQTAQLQAAPEAQVDSAQHSVN